MPAPLVRIDPGWQIFAQPHHDLAGIDAARHRRRLFAPRHVVGVRDRGVRAPANLVRRLQPFERRGERRRRGIDREMRTIDAAKFLRIGMHVHERLLRVRNFKQRVALRRHFAEPCADGDDHIRRLHARQQLRIDADAKIAGVTGVQRIHQMRAAERGRDRHAQIVRRNAPPRRRHSPTNGCRRAAPAAAPPPTAIFCSFTMSVRPGHDFDRFIG